MAELLASAQPEKRLFISLLTRDISLLEAVLDLVDNSINSAILKQKRPLDKAQDYINLLEVKETKKTPSINIEFDNNRFVIDDTCGGISLKLAQNEVFKFGKAEDEANVDESDGDRLSVYGIGLKRAIFKLGDHIEISSNHSKRGFEMDLRVNKWQRTPQQEWSIPITAKEPDRDQPYGTKISVTDLHENISKRLTDDSFEGELRERLSKTYAYFAGRIVNITVNNRLVDAADLKFGENIASESFTVEDVDAAVLAGISIPAGKSHTSEAAGWYIFCNGRGVAFADKSNLTGWGTFLPTYQPKFRPFLGIVFFASVDPESLPWTTTKSAINQESEVWQHALRVMNLSGRQVTSFLTSRYPEDGVQISMTDLTDTAGKEASALKSLTIPQRSFVPTKPRKRKTSIQIKVLEEDINKIKKYLGKKHMSNVDVGHYIFEYFLTNVVEEE